MRVVFFGTPELAVPTLEAVMKCHELLAVVCRPDRPKKRSKRPVPPPVKKFALEHGIHVQQPTKLNDGEFEAWLRGLAPDICCLVAYGRILKQPILDVPEHGFLNMHPSLLPRHRGPSPIKTAIREGDEVTGVTIMRLDTGMDTGDILLQKRVPIADDDTAGSLSDRLARVGAGLMLKALEIIESGQAVFTPQDHQKATTTKGFEKADARIDWTTPARHIHNLVRATNPWPVAHCMFRGEVCRIHRTDLPENDTAAGPPPATPGTVVRVDDADGIVVATGEGSLRIVEIQMPGKRAMPTRDFLKGTPVEPGETFENLR